MTYDFMGFKNMFRPGEGVGSESPIETGEDLLHCMREWSNAPSGLIISTIKNFGGRLLISRQGLLMVEIPLDKVNALNIILSGGGNGFDHWKKASRIGIPDRIGNPDHGDPLDGRDPDKVWQTVYGVPMPAWWEKAY